MHIEGPLARHGGGWRPLVYCWRGGQRSGSFASILAQIGWRVEVVDGGYRSYRRLVSRLLYQDPLAQRVVLIDGGTGTGKTQLLHHLEKAGAQTVDLEGLAAHRGSNFGGLHEAQPTQKMFESRLARILAALDPARPVFLEAESSAIGRIRLPPSLWKAMAAAPVIRLEAPPTERARFLTTTYPDLTDDPGLLARRIDSLRPYHARDRIEAWHALAREGRHAALAEALIVEHYDPRYRRPSRGERAELGVLALRDLDEGALADAASRAMELAGDPGPD
jgi:tRNA 2-selenouridine synthase